MPLQVVNGAMLQCSSGMAPSSLFVLPKNQKMSGNMPAANIMDHIPMMNILPFGMCQSPANPLVAAATAAALGVLTPMPCIPATASPWAPGSATKMLANFPALNSTSQCACNWAGVISITNPGQTTEMIP